MDDNATVHKEKAVARSSRSQRAMSPVKTAFRIGPPAYRSCEDRRYAAKRQPTPASVRMLLTLAADAGVAPLALAQPGQQAAWTPGTPAWTLGWGQLNARKSPGGYYYFADRRARLLFNRR
jgi:hypothetical protein